MKKKLIGLLLLALAAIMVAAAIHAEGGAVFVGLALAALPAYFGLRRFGLFSRCKRVSKASPQSAPGANPAASSAPRVPSSPASAPSASVPVSDYTFVNFHVAGTTFKNDDQSDRQTILRHIKFQDPPYVTSGDVEVQIKEYEFRGQQAFRCLVNGYEIGNVPRDKIRTVAEAMRHEDVVVSGFHVIGGGVQDGEKLNYGCSITLKYRSR